MDEVKHFVNSVCVHCAPGREANRDGNPPSAGQCPPGGMQILIDPVSHEITIVTSQDVNTSSNRTDGASSSAMNSNDVADDDCMEETDSDSSGHRR